MYVVATVIRNQSWPPCQVGSLLSYWICCECLSTERIRTQVNTVIKPSLIAGHRHLGWSLSELGALLGLSRSTASKLLYSHGKQVQLPDRLVREITDELRLW